MGSILLSLFVQYLKANPTAIVAFLESQVAYLKAHPDVAKDLVQALEDAIK